MSKSSMTVRDVFELPKPGGEEPEGWKSFGKRVSEEVKGIKSAALPDVAEKVAELFEIPIPDIFLTSWKKAESIKALLEESRSAPETVMNTELGEHAINSVHRPHIEIRIQNKTVKKIEFTLKLAFNLKGFVLKIQNGAIRGIQTGQCEVKGKLEYKDLVIAEKKLAPITLPGALSFDGAPVETQTEAAALKPPATITDEKASTKIEEGVKEIVEVKPQEVAVSAPSDLSEPAANVTAVEQSERYVAPASVGESIADAKERTTWEVGDSEDDSVTSSAAERPQDVIDLMSRELADRQRTGNEATEIADHAKSAH
ncbi:MAG TPA: hypothetical protein VEW46_04450 [Pyrinomonadaceae bacterium]|nr:hypothetical protein [Pyrinomonadaceae bacterium]